MNQQNTLQIGYLSASYNEVLYWPVQAGVTLFFRDPDGKHLYVKSATYNPYDKPVIEVYAKEQQTTTAVPEAMPIEEPKNNQNEDISSKMMAFMEKMSDRMDALEKRFYQKPYYKKEGNKQ